MVCYAIPLSLSVILFALRKRAIKDSSELHWLNLMLSGGAVMLVIDHFWNGELFLIGENLFSDLLLGVLMTAGVFVFWGIMIAAGKAKAPAPVKAKA
ncbi:MAG: hypothetical protein V1494_08395 [Candidatus Diapherotrites archaeon]